MNKIFFAFVLLVLTGVQVVPATAQPKVEFNRDVRPILSDNCFQCHGPDKKKRKADLRLDQADGIGDAFGETTLEDNEAWQRLISTDDKYRMPPPTAHRDITAKEKAIIKRWIAEGADYKDHWAFVAPKRPALPQVRQADWPRNAIDYFVLARLERDKLQPSEPAARHAIARRVSLDLVGLPPDWKTVAAFAADQSPQAYEQLVDQLLKSPRYGEHWAVMWLDAARYADTNGYNNDTPRYNWRYRDWVIQALNRNMRYDRFVTEQLAGDLLPKPTLDQLVASGFNRNHNVTSEGGIIDEEYRLEYVADRVHTTSTVFMALTLRCARCHDHKFDPLSQQEYYQFFGFFNQVPETGYHKEHVGNPNPVVNAPTAEQASKLAALDKAIAECDKLLAARPKAEGGSDPERDRLLKEKAELTKQQQQLTKQIPTAMVMRDMPKNRDTFFLNRGAYDQRGDKVALGVPQILPPFPSTAPRNRLGLAQWLTSPSHPLTARVIVNRLWAELFGQGLVTTQEDFGTQGAAPSHPELLDWLAVELMESGWDVQHLLRQIVTSATYRQSSRVSREHHTRDPNNTLMGRGPRFRMKAETLRDSALAVSGLLINSQGGPSVKPYQPAGLWVEVQVTADNYSGGPYIQSKGDDLYRRSVYTWWKRTCPPPNLNTFDAPDREFCRVQRSRTNTPLQALVLLNDPTFVEAARALAQRAIANGGPTVRDRISFIFRQSVSRVPQAKELAILEAALARYQARFEADPAAANKLLSVGASKPAAKVNVAELAAYSAVASMILNLDEFVTK
jgi:hypothetical protein